MMQFGPKWLVVSGFAALFSICAKSWAEPPADARKELNPDASRIEALLKEQEAAWNKGDLEGFMQGYWKSRDLTFYSGRNIERGWDATYERYKKRYKSDGKEMGTLTFSDLVIDRIADDAYLVRGRWKLKLSSSNPDGLYTLIVKKKPEGWRIVHDHTSIGEPEKKQP